MFETRERKGSSIIGILREFTSIAIKRKETGRETINYRSRDETVGVTDCGERERERENDILKLSPHKLSRQSFTH